MTRGATHAGEPSNSQEALPPPSPIPPEKATRRFGLPLANLGWSAFRNTAAQVSGRMLVAAARLVVVALIVRSFGNATFAEYAVLLGILSIAEWLVDFGTTDVFVREICREPEGAGRLLRILTAWKAVQVPVAIAFVALVAVAMGLAEHVFEAALVAAASLIFYAGVVVYRVIFRATLTMEREMVAEIVSVVVMIGLIALFAMGGRGGLVALVACHLVSRIVFFGLCFLFGRSRHPLSVGGVRWADLRWTFASTGAIGANGFLAVAYVAADILLLSRLASLNDVAYYSSAQRFILPVLMIQASVGGTLYSVAASHWPRSKDDFARACRRGLEAAVMIAGVAICSLGTAPGFFMGLLGPDLVPGAMALRILALQPFFAAVPSTIGLVLYVVHGQAYVLRFILATLAAKVLLLTLIAPRYGFAGAAGIALGLEFAGAIFGIAMLRRITSIGIRWAVPIKVALIAAAAITIVSWAGLEGLPAAVSATAIYLLLLFPTRTLDFGELQALLPRRAAS